MPGLQLLNGLCAIVLPMELPWRVFSDDRVIDRIIMILITTRLCPQGEKRDTDQRKIFQSLLFSCNLDVLLRLSLSEFIKPDDMALLFVDHTVHGRLLFHNRTEFHKVEQGLLLKAKGEFHRVLDGP